MRNILAMAALLSCIGATAPDRVENAPPANARSAGNEANGPSEHVCSDKIQSVRAERGLPSVRRESASDDEPLFIKAVDHRIDGCSAMIMAWDTSDVRPLPQVEVGEPRLRPAR
ncbi:hypothetical protein [Tsuneonella sp. HG222]